MRAYCHPAPASTLRSGHGPCVLRSAGPTVLGCGNNSIENISTPQLRRLRRTGRCHRQQLTNRRAARSSLGGRPSASMPCVENVSAVAGGASWGSAGLGYFRKRVFRDEKYRCDKPLKSAQHNVMWLSSAHRLVVVV